MITYTLFIPDSFNRKPHMVQCFQVSVFFLTDCLSLCLQSEYRALVDMDYVEAK